MRSRVFTAAFLRSTAPVLIALCALTAWAGDNPIAAADYDGMRQVLIGTDEAIRNDTLEADRKGILSELKDAPRDNHPDVYGAVMGPIFKKAELSKHLGEVGRRHLYAQLIAHLADAEPEDTDNILLAEAFFPLLVADEELPALVRKKLPTDRKTKRKKGWERILTRARAMLDDKDDAVRRAAIRISAQCECEGVAAAAAALYDALKTAPSPMPAEDAEAYLTAAGYLLSHRFPDVGQLQSFLEPFAPEFAKRQAWENAVSEPYRIRGDLLKAVVELLKETGGARETSAARAALTYGKLLIEKATDPAELLAFFDPKNERFVELQRAALKAAKARMKPVPDEAWARLLRSALGESTDREVLAGIIEILGPTFTKRSDDTHQLATDVATRLQQRAETDDPKLREKLARYLGDIGARGDVLKALPDAIDMFDAEPAQIPVYGVLIRALGRVEDGLGQTLRPYYVTSGARRPPVWQRESVAKALGYGGLRGDPLQAKTAGLFLRYILTGAAVGTAENVAAGIPADREADHLLLDKANAEDDPAVRTAAIESLQWYPGAATAAVLGVIAAEDSTAAAKALTILGRQLASDSVDAALALAGLISPDAPDKLVLAVLDAILKVKDAPQKLSPEALKALSAAARIALQDGKSDEVRARASKVSVHLADAEALKLHRITWSSLAEKPDEQKLWGERLGALFVAVATAGRDDLALAEELGEMAMLEFRDEVLGFFEKIGKAADREILKRKRADIYYVRGTDSERPKAEQRKDLERAAVLYTDLLGVMQKPADRLDLFRTLMVVYEDRGAAERLAEGENTAAWLLQAYRVAGDSKDATLAQRALESLATPLKESKDLSDAERKEVEKLTKMLEALTGK